MRAALNLHRLPTATPVRRGTKPRRLPCTRAVVALAAVSMVWMFAATARAAGPPALEPPTGTEILEARVVVDAMKLAERGPYSRIRWYCADGSVLAPTSYACSQHGGGVQHAEYSDARQRLFDLGWPAGTILTATSWRELWESKPRQARLRELPVEHYLVSVDDGWVLRRARYYRGYVQIEDEEKAGGAHLLAALARGDWVADNFLLVRELARALPHRGAEDRTRRIRRLSQELAERDKSFEAARIKIHTRPDRADIDTTRTWLSEARKRAAGHATLSQAASLLDELTTLYSPAARLQRIAAMSDGVGAFAGAAIVSTLLSNLGSRSPAERAARLAKALAAVREVVTGTASPATKLAVLDLSLEVEAELLLTANELLATNAVARSSLISLALDLVEAGYGVGLLSSREHAQLSVALRDLTRETSASPQRYAAAVQTLKRAGDWAVATVRYTFAEALVRYAALEPKAWRFSDDVLRSSALLPLAELTQRLSVDAEARVGLSHRVFGRRYSAMSGLNPGVAKGVLRIVTPEQAATGFHVERDEIVVLPATVSDLDPVGGILSLAAGNLLSHVQLLARNLGIPNASLPPYLLAELQRHEGEPVLLAVGSDGAVFLDRLEAARSIAPQLVAVHDAAPTARAERLLDPPRPDLMRSCPITLDELKSGLSGTVVGPKAANLGELARQFPGRVAPAIALPFGIFAAHVRAGTNPPKARLDRAFARYRAGESDAAELAAEVEEVRRTIAALTVAPGLREELAATMEQLFGPTGSYGVFVRSDTNVEDLPGFTGAGLNQTIANVVGLDAQMAAVARVWASPFAARAMAWRSSVLSRPEEVYTSVLIMKSVAAEKSGVMVTSDLRRRAPGLTVATAWGLGGAVDGEAAETIVVDPHGAVELLAEAKAPYKRVLNPAGGVTWSPAAAGAVLTERDLQALRRLAAEVEEKITVTSHSDEPPQPWDIEFGFVGGELTLFQIRPLVERGQAAADRAIAALIPRGEPDGGEVDLGASIRSAPSPSASNGGG